MKAMASTSARTCHNRRILDRKMFSVLVNTLSATIPLSIAPTTTIGDIKNAICESEKMSADQFELALQDQQLTDVTMTADACGITRDCFITVLEKPMNPVSNLMIWICKCLIVNPLCIFVGDESFFSFCETIQFPSKLDLPLSIPI